MYSVHAHTNTFAMRFQYVANVAIQQVQSMYRSLVKEHPLTKEHPPPTFGPISCMGSKFTWMICAPTMEQLFTWSLRSTAIHVHIHGDTAPFRLLCAVRTHPLADMQGALPMSTLLWDYSTCIYVLRSIPTFRAQINKTLLILTHNFGLKVSYIRGSTEHMCIPLEMFPMNTCAYH